MVNIVVGRPVVNAANLYINGLGIAYASATTLTLASGAARDVTNKDDIVLGSAVTINAATNGANGLDTGALANSTFYYVYVIGSSLSNTPSIAIATQQSVVGGTSVNGTVLTETTVTQPSATSTDVYATAGLLSASATAPLLPTGYDMYRRVGAVLTSGAAAILAFYQIDNGNGTTRTFYYDEPIQVLNNGVQAAFTAINLSTAVPAAAMASGLTNVIFNLENTPTGADDTAHLSAASTSTNGQVIMSGDAAGVAHRDNVACPVGLVASVPTVYYKVTGSLDVFVNGYADKL